MRVTLLPVLLLAVTAPRALHAQRFSALGVTDAQGARFFTDLQHAVAVNDRAAVVRMVNFPLHVSRAHSDQHTIATSGELLRQYDAIFTPAVRSAITSEKFATLFVSADGAAIKRGVVWLNGTCTHHQPPMCHLGVSSVNLP